MVDGWQKLTIQYYIPLSGLTNNLYKGGKFILEIINNADFLFSQSSRKNFSKSQAWACGPRKA